MSMKKDEIEMCKRGESKQKPRVTRSPRLVLCKLYYIILTETSNDNLPFFSKRIVLNFEQKIGSRYYWGNPDGWGNPDESG